MAKVHRSPKRTHFGARSELLDAMLDRWEQVATQAIIDEVEALGGSPEAKLRALFSIAVRSAAMALETAMRQWAALLIPARRTGRRTH